MTFSDKALEILGPYTSLEKVRRLEEAARSLPCGRASADAEVSAGLNAEPSASLRELLAMKLVQYECDREMMAWPKDKCRAILAAVSQPHSGDCVKQPWTCMTCVAEDAYRFADSVIAALPHTEDKE